MALGHPFCIGTYIHLIILGFGGGGPSSSNMAIGALVSANLPLFCHFFATGPRECRLRPWAVLRRHH